MTENTHVREAIGENTAVDTVTENPVPVENITTEELAIESEVTSEPIIESEITTPEEIISEDLTQAPEPQEEAPAPAVDKEAEALKAAVAASGTYHLNAIVQEFVEKNISPIAQSVAQIASTSPEYADRKQLWTYEEVKEIWDRVTLELAARATAAFKNQEETVSVPDAV